MKKPRESNHGFSANALRAIAFAPSLRQCELDQVQRVTALGYA